MTALAAPERLTMTHPAAPPVEPTTDVAPSAVDLPELEFVLPLAGFPTARRFVLVRHDESSILFDLRSLDDPDLRFVAVAPAPFFPDYAPEIDDSTAEALGLTDAADALLLVLVTVGEDAASATANLKAPLVVNLRTLRAGQAVLVDNDLPVRRLLRAA